MGRSAEEREPCLIAVHAFLLPEDVQDLASSIDARVEPVESVEAALDRLPERGRFLLVSGDRLNEGDLLRFAERWAALVNPHASALFVAEEPAAHRLLSLLARLPRITVVTQGPRSAAFLVESVAAALGLPVHERTDSGTWMPARMNGANAWFQFLGRSWGLLTRAAGLSAGDQVRATLEARERVLEVRLKAELPVGPDRWVVRMLDLREAKLPLLAGAFDAHLDSRRGHVRFTVPARLSVVARVQPPDGTRRSYLRVVDVSIAGFRWLARGYDPGYAVGQALEAVVTWGHRRLTCVAQVQWRRAVDAGHELGVRIRSLDREGSALLHELIRQIEQHVPRGLPP